MRMLRIEIACGNAAFDENGGTEVARLLLEAGEHIERAWGGALPGEGKGPVVVALRGHGGNLFGCAVLGPAEEKDVVYTGIPATVQDHIRHLERRVTEAERELAAARQRLQPEKETDL